MHAPYYGYRYPHLPLRNAAADVNLVLAVSPLDTEADSAWMPWGSVPYFIKLENLPSFKFREYIENLGNHEAFCSNDRSANGRHKQLAFR